MFSLAIPFQLRRFFEKLFNMFRTGGRGECIYNQHNWLTMLELRWEAALWFDPIAFTCWFLSDLNRNETSMDVDPLVQSSSVVLSSVSFFPSQITNIGIFCIWNGCSLSADDCDIDCRILQTRCILYSSETKKSYSKPCVCVCDRIKCRKVTHVNPGNGMASRIRQVFIIFYSKEK